MKAAGPGTILVAATRIPNMPELPEVQTIVTELNRAITGRKIREVRVNRADFIRTESPDFTRRLLGRTVGAVEREGKRILMELANGVTCVFHLGMSGNIALQRPTASLLPHTHLQIRFRGVDRELRFRDPRRFGGIWLIDDDREGSLAPLGPDALTIRVPMLRRICERNRQIKALMLDQQIISGLGNIYCDEALFAARIHPLRCAADLAEGEVRRLGCCIRKTLRRAVEAGGSTLRDYRRSDGSTGMFQISHRVYGREGARCRSCGTTIERIQVAGRSTHVCPQCQSYD